jgi:hypothetical protein
VAQVNILKRQLRAGIAINTEKYTKIRKKVSIKYFITEVSQNKKKSKFFIMYFETIHTVLNLVDPARVCLKQIRKK